MRGTHLGRDDIGHLATGCAADIVLIDFGQLCYAGGLHDPLACVLFVGDTGQVDTTIVGGRILVTRGRLAEANLRKLASNANKAAAAMVRRLRARTGQDFGSVADRLVRIRNGRAAVLVPEVAAHQPTRRKFSKIVICYAVQFGRPWNEARFRRCVRDLA